MTHPEVPTTEPESPRSMLGEVSACGCLTSMITDVKESNGREVVLVVKAETVFCEEHGEDLDSHSCEHTLTYTCPHNENVRLGKLILVFLAGLVAGAAVVLL